MLELFVSLTDEELLRNCEISFRARIN